MQTLSTWLIYTIKAFFFLTTYCVQYLHTMPHLRNEIPYSLLKTPKAHALQEGVVF